MQAKQWSHSTLSGKKQPFGTKDRNHFQRPVEMRRRCDAWKSSMLLGISHPELDSMMAKLTSSRQKSRCKVAIRS